MHSSVENCSWGSMRATTLRNGPYLLAQGIWQGLQIEVSRKAVSAYTAGANTRSFTLKTSCMSSCSAYCSQRADFWREVSDETSSKIMAAMSSDIKLTALFTSSCRCDWKAFGRFIARARQIRRRMKVNMARQSEKIESASFDSQKKAWRASGKHVCRHGVFFDTSGTWPC